MYALKKYYKDFLTLPQYLMQVSSQSVLISKACSKASPLPPFNSSFTFPINSETLNKHLEEGSTFTLQTINSASLSRDSALLIVLVPKKAKAKTTMRAEVFKLFLRFEKLK